jgi:3-dehydroquinate synthase
MAADLSQRLGWLSDADIVRMDKIFKAANLPTEAPNLGVDKYLDLMGLDKKVVDGKIRLVLQQGIGKSVVTSDYDAALLKQTLTLA